MKHCCIWTIAAVALCTLVFGLACVHASAELEFRAFWADAFHNGFKSQAQCDQLIADVQAAHCNALIVQVRRRGDTYFPSSYEPFASDADPNFDALKYLIDKAHSAVPRIEVHAWMCTLPIWNSQTAPSSQDHPMNRFPQYLTKTASGVTWDGSGYVFDPGHPGALDYTTNVYLDVVRRYDVDGIHYDYVRFYGRDRGYNDVSVARFLAAHPGKTLPLDNDDEEWVQWRRDQVTALVRRTYAKALAINPNIKVSGSTITWGDGPTSEDQWYSSSAYSAVMQDWRSWMEEGILDINCPMTYYRDYKNADMYDHWIAFEKDHKYGRQLVVGPGVYLNTVEDTMSQIRETRIPTALGNKADGITMYSYACTNDENMDGLNNAQDVPQALFFSALVSPTSTYNGGDPPFADVVETPPMPWKTDANAPGHLAGSVTANGVWVDGAVVHLTGYNLPPEGRVTRTDGTGFYAFIGLKAGVYDVSVDSPYGPRSRSVVVSPHQVCMADFTYAGPQATVISNIKVDKTTTSTITVTWNTDVLATSQLRYGPTPALGKSTDLYGYPETSHSVTIWGLPKFSSCYFQVVSNGAASPIYCATTLPDSTATSTSIIVDNPQGTYETDGTNIWNTGTSSKDKYGADYNYTNTADIPGCWFAWFPVIPVDGNYAVYVWYPQGSNRSKEAKYTIYYNEGTIEASVNQQVNGGKWNLITNPDGIPLTADGGTFIELSNYAPAGKVVIADAVKFVLVRNAPSVPTGLHPTNVQLGSVALDWSPSTGKAGVAGYKIYRNGVQAGTSVDTSFVDTCAPAGTSLSYTVSAFDPDDLESAQSDPATVFGPSVPSTPVVRDTGPYSLDRSQFSAVWSSSDLSSGIAGYEVAVGTSSGASDLIDWTLTTAASISVNIHAQPYGGKVFFSVRAKNNNGAWSDVGTSHGVIIAWPVHSIAEAKMLPDDTPIMFAYPKMPSYAGDNCFYIQENGGYSGIRVDGTVNDVDSPVLVAGVLSRTYRERVISQAWVQQGSGSGIRLSSIAQGIHPLAMTGRDLGGADFKYNPSTGAGQCATYAWRWVKMPDETMVREFLPVGGTNNLGVLVKISGRVSWAGTDGTFYLNDGSGYDDYKDTMNYDPTQTSFTGNEQAGPAGVKIVVPTGTAAPPIGSYASVIGVVSCYSADGKVLRVLRADKIDIAGEDTIPPPPPI